MYLDLHTHFLISRESEFHPQYILEFTQEAHDLGVDMIVLTEHFNATYIRDLYNHLETNFEYKDGFYHICNIRVVLGLEIDVKNHGHILTFGGRDEIYELMDFLTPYEKAPYLIKLNALIDKLDAMSLPKIGAHPFRPSMPLYKHPDDLLERLDAVEVNAADIYQLKDKQTDKVKGLVDSLNIGMVGSSDAHHPIQLTTVLNKCDDVDDVEELKSTIRHDAVDVLCSDELHLRVQAAEKIRKLMNKLYSSH